MMTQGPILKLDNFISPLFCEDIIDRSNSNIFNIDNNNQPTKTNIFNELSEIRYRPYLDDLIEDYIDNYYKTSINYISKTVTEWYPENYKSEIYNVDGYSLVNKKWIATQDVDFISICYLNDYNNKPNFDNSYEVYGGELSFNSFAIKIKPKRGTLILFPAHPSFTYKIDKVSYGNLYVLKNTLTSLVKYQYNANNFSGTPEKWSLEFKTNGV